MEVCIAVYICSLAQKGTTSVRGEVGGVVNGVMGPSGGVLVVLFTSITCECRFHFSIN